MAYTTINKPSNYFNTKLYTGNNNATQTITGVGFQPDFTWIKCRDTNENHHLADFVRGANKFLHTNLTNAERTGSYGSGYNTLAFTSDGFSLTNPTSANDELNFGTRLYSSWNWLASNTTASNTAGTITSTVSANTTSGFSIVSYTGDGVNNRTVGHGLGATPKFIIIKNRSEGTAYWTVINPRSTSTSDTNILYLNRTDAEADDLNIMGTNLPNSTTFGIGNYVGVNVNAQNFIAYCFAPIKGYSSMGQYTGNGSTDGTFVYTGFKPAFVFIKKTSAIGQWYIWDNKRNTYNVMNLALHPNTTDTDQSYGTDGIDILSNGFKLKSVYSYLNASSATYVYMAFAEQPLVATNNVPCTAR